MNSFLRQSQSNQPAEGRLSLIAFDSSSIDVLRDSVPLSTCAELIADEYQPRGGTPLLDAVGHGVRVLDQSRRPNERMVLAIMTDGLENASKEYSKEAIKALLERKQKEDGWLVVYLGADHDAWHQAHQMGLTAGNTAMFARSAADAAMSAVAGRASRYACALTSAEGLAGGFTDEERSSLRRGGTDRK